MKRGSDTRSLESEELLLTLSLDEALALLAQPKQHGRRAAAPPLKELGPDPVSGKPLVVKNGRFGPYVTDGETNASLRSSDSVETLSFERAVELMAARRERGPGPPRPARSAPRKRVGTYFFRTGSPWLLRAGSAILRAGDPCSPSCATVVRAAREVAVRAERGRENQRIHRFPWNSEDKCRTVRRRHLR